jgi:succinate dehydrogenase / fumarate reductase, cytochrome b subunit
MHMALKRNVGLRGLTYAGGGPMLAWVLHRISGLGIIIFVSIHVLAGFSTHVVGSAWGDPVNRVYESLPFQIFILFCVLYHALNGLRIVLLDFWPRMLEHQRLAIYLQWAIFIPVFGLSVFLMIRSALASG